MSEPDLFAAWATTYHIQLWLYGDDYSISTLGGDFSSVEEAKLVLDSVYMGEYTMESKPLNVLASYAYKNKLNLGVILDPTSLMVVANLRLATQPTVSKSS